MDEKTKERLKEGLKNLDAEGKKIGILVIEAISAIDVMYGVVMRDPSICGEAKARIERLYTFFKFAPSPETADVIGQELMLATGKCRTCEKIDCKNYILANEDRFVDVEDD